MKVLNTINNFRVCTISQVAGIDENRNLIINELGVDKGLGIEYCYDGEHYIVVSFIKVKNGSAYLDWVRDKVLSFSPDELLDWQMVCNEAMNYLSGILEVLT